jgi:hypothetical protein
MTSKDRRSRGSGTPVTSRLWRALFPSLRTFVELGVPGCFLRPKFRWFNSLDYANKGIRDPNHLSRLMCSLIRADTPQLNTRTLEAL